MNECMPLHSAGSSIAAVNQGPLRASRGAAEVNYSAGRRILIVEDDLSLAGFLSRELQAERFSVDLVHDGEEALSMLQNERRFDLLILDLNLPKLDGIS